MFEQGWPEEVAKLEAAGLFHTPTASRALGYAEVSKFNNGQLTESEAIEQVMHATNRYSRRQMQWFRRDEYIHWFDALDSDLLSGVLKLI
jgi:tRNA dimethylallyltransferase